MLAKNPTYVRNLYGLGLHVGVLAVGLCKNPLLLFLSALCSIGVIHMLALAFGSLSAIA